MNSLAERLDISTPTLWLIIVIAIVQIALQLYSLFDLWHRDRVAGGHKWLWLLVIVFGNLVGVLLYLFVGRHAPPEIIERPVSHRDSALSHSTRIDQGVDTLYGSDE